MAHHDHHQHQKQQKQQQQQHHRYVYIKDQIKARDILIDFNYLWPGDFKGSNEISK